jgi:hypothetical protein
VFVIGRAAENRHPLFGPPDLFEYSRVRTENRFALFLADARGVELIRQAGENGTILLSADDAIARGDSDSTTCCSMTTLED